MTVLILEAFAEFGWGAAFRLAEEAVEMAQGVETAGVADVGHGTLGGEQQACCDTETIVDEIAVGRASRLVAEKARKRLIGHADQTAHIAQADIVHIMVGNVCADTAYAFVLILLAGIDKRRRRQLAGFLYER